ncbi:hypothetical protein FB567DRAFT_53436 [Paraphoma chrysanthemicola]|uniref:Uncharacterized protein n=1 Tax=Paraphoma chrysanthemicola TaxID=798071 RepID=A0A8K0R7K4_9PLEO|nr:hypothetical protein FB567DRAFT_53436 [Paraphoma chrysanthemicola]
MAATLPLGTSRIPATTPELIQALAQHQPLFQKIAEYPQAAIHNRYIGEWAMLGAYSEGRVDRSAFEVRQFLQANSQGEVKDHLESTLHTTMTNLAEDLFQHLHVTKALSDMVLANPPSTSGIAVYRVWSGSDHGGRRAPNGQLLSTYGKEGEPAPTHFASCHNENLDPISEFMANWLMNPFLNFVVSPVRRVILKVPIVRDMLRSNEPNVPAVDVSVIKALSKHVVSATAVLCLTAAILTLEAIRDPKWRIVIAALFAMVFSVPAQYIGSRSLPFYLLILAYFQMTVVFLGNTNDQKRHQ